MANDVPSIRLWLGQMQQEQVTMPLRSAVYAADLLLVEDGPAGSSFAVVAVEMDQRVEFAHLVHTVVADAAVSAGVVGLVASLATASASDAAFVIDFDSFVFASGAVVDCIDQ